MRYNILNEVMEHIKHVVLDDKCWVDITAFCCDDKMPSLTEYGKNIVAEYLQHIGAHIIHETVENSGYWVDVRRMRDGTTSIRFLSGHESKIDPIFKRI